MIDIHRFLCHTIFGLLALTATIQTQEDNGRYIPSYLLECYNNSYLLQKDNLLPRDLESLIAIVQKIESTQGLNMDLRALSVALLHRFRLDGIQRTPDILQQEGVTPYAPRGIQFHKGALTLKVIPGNALLFPNDSLSAIERCTLHSMISTSIETAERGDEATTCKFTHNNYRFARSVDRSNEDPTFNSGDVETLSPEQISIITNGNKDTATEDDGFDPNAIYPVFPPNHPDIAKMQSNIPVSKCPVENGVLTTDWGTVSAGPVLAGIAAGLQPQILTLGDLLQNDNIQGYASSQTADNKWLVTIAADLAEVSLLQGPRNAIKIGEFGHWNSTALPRWYFLDSNENLFYTAAEVRGNLDGLILANEIQSLYAKIPNLRLSQVLDMYYSPRGLLNNTIRACNRRLLLTAVAPTETMNKQAHSATLIQRKYFNIASIDVPTLEKFSIQAAKALSVFIPSSLNDDLTCTQTNQNNEFNKFNVDLTIVVDTTWPFASIQPILRTLLRKVEIGPYNSNFTLINGFDGQIMINNSNSILDFDKFNISNYKNFTAGLDLPRIIESLRILKREKLSDEKLYGIGGSQSDVILIVPYTSSITESDKWAAKDLLKIFHEDIPDSLFLFLTYNSKDKWSDFTLDSTKDIFSISIGDTTTALASLNNLIARIKNVPKRLINSQCGAEYHAQGSPSQFVDYVEPSSTKVYRMHPNYFFSTDSGYMATIKVQGAGWGPLTVCSARTELIGNSTQNGAFCVSVTSNTHTMSISCPDASMIHECSPFYLSVTANSTTIDSYRCTDQKVCRFPDSIKYTISYENLVCVSGGHLTSFSVILLLLTFLHFLP